MNTWLTGKNKGQPQNDCTPGIVITAFSLSFGEIMCSNCKVEFKGLYM